MSKKSQPPRKREPLTHDRFFELTFQMREVATAFLRATLPKELSDALDLDALTPAPTDTIATHFRKMRADVIYNVPVRGSGEYVSVYVVMEHKSYDDFWAVHQAWQYAVQICYHAVKAVEKNNNIPASFRLPPVIAIIVHHGKTTFTGPTQLADLFKRIPGFETFVPHMQAILFDLTAMKESEIPDDPDVPAMCAVLRIMQVIFQKQIGVKSREIIRELKERDSESKYYELLRIICYYVIQSGTEADEEDTQILTQTIKEVIGEEMPTLVENWVAQGETKGKAESILLVLTTRFLSVPDSLEARVKAIKDVERLDELTRQAASCTSLEEFVASLDAQF